MDVDEEMPPLAPEVKINMKLDDIIKYEKMKAGVSHNLQFRQGRGGRKFRPYFKRRYPSQNWRLRGNGPNTPRFRRYQSGYHNLGKIRAFLERKWKTTPMNSVFQRLGRNPLQESAKAKIWNARNYFRPQRPHFFYLKKFNQKHIHDPDRVKKLIRANRLYTYRLGDGLGGRIDDNHGRVPALTKTNLEKLNEVMGGQITSVKEEESEPGTVVTTIISKIPISTENNSFNHGNAMISNGYNCASSLNAGFIGGSAMNGMGGNHNYNETDPMNRYGVHSMNGIGIHSRNNMPTDQMYANSMSSSSSMSNFTGNHSSGYQINGIRATNGLSRTANFWSQQQMIQSLNQPQPSNENRVPSQSNFGRGIDLNLPINHSTNRSITSRFGGPSTIAVVDSFSSM